MYNYTFLCLNLNSFVKKKGSLLKSAPLERHLAGRENSRGSVSKNAALDVSA